MSATAQTPADLPAASLPALRVAIARARRAGDPAAEEEARRRYVAAYLEAEVQRALATAPPLTDEQADRIAALLRPSSPPPPDLVAERRRDAEASRTRDRHGTFTREAARMAAACAICGTPDFVHPKGEGVHAWQPRTPDEITRAITAAAAKAAR